MDKHNLCISVECAAGQHDEQVPNRVFLGERKVDVFDVKDRWLGPDHQYFKVQGSDGGTYIVRHDVRVNRWELTMFER